ncbi:MAG: AMP-binding protein, partial [Acidiferrobacteraceae bacterium]|nr:AMP-binding protein [Acidiferrobacteraceae bacterium]
MASVDPSLSLNQNLYLLLRQHFPADPDTAWLVLPDGRCLRYGDIDATTACYAGALHSLGIGHGDRVLAQIDKSPEALLLYLATLRLGAIYVPLNTAYTPTEVAYFLGDARPGLFIARPDREATLSEAAQATATTLLTLDESGQGSLRERVDQATPLKAVTTVSGDEIASIIYTSGTTGRSKGAMLSHDNLASNALALRTLWGFVGTDILLHALPIYHLHGLFVAVHCAMLRGIPMLFLPRFDPVQVLTHLRSATVMMGVPTFYTRLLQTEGFDRASCEHMRLFISGSAPLLAQTWQAFYQHTGHRILERYGMSEAGMI